MEWKSVPKGLQLATKYWVVNRPSPSDKTMDKHTAAHLSHAEATLKKALHPSSLRMSEYNSQQIKMGMGQNPRTLV